MNLLGRLSSPAGKESTPFEFYFWVAQDKMVELTNLVKVVCHHQDEEVVYYGIVDEVFRSSTLSSISDDVLRFDGKPENNLPIQSRGHFYAKVLVTRIEPLILIPPREESYVYLAENKDLMKVYSFESIKKPLKAGFLQNGFRGPSTPAMVNLDYLDGTNGAHVNVNGITGVATKTSYLLFFIKSFLAECQKYNEAHPSGDKMFINPIIFNLKGEDLMWLDKENINLTPEVAREYEALNILPQPFERVGFYVPRRVVSNKESITPFSSRLNSEVMLWSLKEIKERDLLEHLYSDDDLQDENFRASLYAVNKLIEEEENITNFNSLMSMLKEKGNDPQPLGLYKSSFQRFLRRTETALEECRSIISRRMDSGFSIPFKDLEPGKTLVIDLHNLKDRAAKFVLASLIKEILYLKEMDPKFENRKFIIMVDELNKFAPKVGYHNNPVAELIIDLSQRGRSLGVFLFGAQQMASQVHDSVIGNSALRVIGNTDPVELSSDAYRFLTPSQKEQVMNLTIGSMMLKQVGFKQPMVIKFPFPCFATRREEVKGEIADLW
ncbi:MAG: hypothetical protein DDT42_00202 [candidate division WS2 bacterium]|uniref:ATP-binding protein n=1 Tax=Psychracetigena formicireducens TaxID=2986056 RepID=A0A9E2BEX4_PSYF1|nr:hypothetical protein [Candidatus Psychracetigena formicireducens]MBT9144363.1 hypothetical protein [Candidatus Psychracetigena formicireducens]